jgi:hypothetical protein
LTGSIPAIEIDASASTLTWNKKRRPIPGGVFALALSFSELAPAFIERVKGLLIQTDYG